MLWRDSSSRAPHSGNPKLNANIINFSQGLPHFKDKDMILRRLNWNLRHLTCHSQPCKQQHMQQSNALLVGVGWNKQLLRCNSVSALKFVSCTGDPENTVALASVQPHSFATEFPIIKNTTDFLFFLTMNFQLLTILITIVNKIHWNH